MELSNRFPGMNSASLCSLAGRYDNPIPTRFLVPIDCLKFQLRYFTHSCTPPPPTPQALAITPPTLHPHSHPPVHYPTPLPPTPPPARAACLLSPKAWESQQVPRIVCLGAKNLQERERERAGQLGQPPPAAPYSFRPAWEGGRGGRGAVPLQSYIQWGL